MSPIGICGMNTFTFTEIQMQNFHGYLDKYFTGAFVVSDFSLFQNLNKPCKKI